MGEKIRYINWSSRKHNIRLAGVTRSLEKMEKRKIYSKRKFHKAEGIDQSFD